MAFTLSSTLEHFQNIKPEKLLCLERMAVYWTQLKVLSSSTTFPCLLVKENFIVVSVHHGTNKHAIRFDVHSSSGLCVCYIQ